MKYIYVLIILSISLKQLSAQNGQSTLRVMWYNVENLFDTVDDPLTDDNEFLPNGNRYWSNKRYYHKLQQIAKVIIAAGEWDTPALVGLCEVENDSTLIHLLTRTPLYHQYYRFCITSGSDTRGINVALLYQRDKFAYIKHTSYPICFSAKGKPTRDILHVFGRIITGDTLDILACHFPSRSGGEKETEIFRLDAARTLRKICDSIYSLRENPNLLLMGDFNDTPTDKSITHVLRAQPYKASDNKEKVINNSLVLENLFASTKNQLFPGTHKYLGEWNQLDQIFINRELTDTTQYIYINPKSIKIFAPEFILKKDKTYRGQRPNRTYYGFKYEGGYSDHLPLLTDIIIKTNSVKNTLPK